MFFYKQKYLMASMYKIVNLNYDLTWNLGIKNRLLCKINQQNFFNLEHKFFQEMIKTKLEISFPIDI